MRSKEELLETAKKEGYFNQSEVLYAASDGNIFLEKHKLDAYAHARRMGTEVIILKNPNPKQVKAESDEFVPTPKMDESGAVSVNVKKTKKRKA